MGNSAGEQPGQMTRVTLRLPNKLHDALEDRVDAGEYPSKSAAIRDGVREITDIEDRGREGGF